MNIHTEIHAESILHSVVRLPKLESENPPLLILLHGFGSNEQDLFSFADKLPDRFLVISLRGPYTIGKDSYAWFHVDFSKGKPVAELDEASKSSLLILQFIEQLKTQKKFDNKQIYLCGFSQGAIMSYSIGLTNPDKIKGILTMSGRILENIKSYVKVTDKLKELKIFITHGTKDNVLVIEYARESYAYLKQLGLNPTYKEYNEEHTISNAMFADMIEWLK
ncbi:MAG TPA: hypothetical protein VNW06_12790 [Cytophagaceae bacterium]|nr:hypothetical protein [Cytophagaceae bacterium]